MDLMPISLPQCSSKFRTCASLAVFGAALGAPHVASAQTGPGLGNLDCGEAEYFEPFAFMENGEGPKGANVAVMVRGYFMVIFAPDSGHPPGEIAIYDVSDPRNPDEVHHIEGGDTNIIRESHSLPVALIDDKQYIAIQTTEGMQFWDFTDPLTAHRVGSIDLPGVNGGDYENVAWQSSWQGRYLYVSGGNQGIYVIDAADPTDPKLLEQVSTSATGGFRVGPLFALGDYLVISNMDQGGAYSVLDIRDPDDPALLSQIGNLPRMYAIVVGANDRIYSAGRDGNFVTHSFADPTTIAPIKDALIGQDQLYAAVQDHFVFLGRQNNVVKVDVSDEQNPEVVGEGTLGVGNPDHGQVTPMGNLIFIGNDHGTGSALFCHQYGRDTTPLVAQSIYPKDGSTGMTTEARVSILFSDYVDTETVNEENVAIRPVGGQALDGIYTYAFNTLSFGPELPLEAETTYEVVLATDGLKDVMGNGLEEEVLVRFSTGDTVVVPPPDAPEPPPGGTGGAATGGAPSGSASGGTTGGFADGAGGAVDGENRLQGGCAMAWHERPGRLSVFGGMLLGLLFVGFTFRRSRRA